MIIDKRMQRENKRMRKEILQQAIKDLKTREARYRAYQDVKRRK